METEYIPSEDFVNIGRARIEAGEKKELTAIDGFNRWVFTREDGTQYILRPLENE